MLPKFQSIQFDLTRDIKTFIETIPKTIPCLVLTTTPNRASNNIQWQRIHAQVVIKRDIGLLNRCSFVAGVNVETNKVFKDNRSFLADSYHASTQGSRWFFDYHHDSICNAINEAKQLASLKK